MKRFRGGIHPDGEKVPIVRSIEDAKLPAKVVIPIHQHVGSPAHPIVETGSKVMKGQKIAEADGFISANVHASISGTVTEMVNYPCPALGCASLSMVIESDGKDEWFDGIKPHGEPDSLSNQQILDIIREAGIVGMGGAGFPTHVKLTVPEGVEVHVIILNGVECEPYLTADHALMLAESQMIADGMGIVMRITGAKQGYIAIERDKPDAIKVMEDVVKDEKNISVVSLKVKYPQGWENTLIKSVLGKEIPPGMLPLDSGIIVSNVSTAYAISNAVRFGHPLIERIVSVTGSGITNPKNLRVRVGTLFSDLIDQCGGLSEDAGKVISGGPMMGFAVSDVDVPVTKCTTGISVLSGECIEKQDTDICIRCGRCINVCPAGLVPRAIALLAKKGKFREAEQYFPMDCKECGSCAYICPAKIPLVQLVQLAKKNISSRMKTAQVK